MPKKMIPKSEAKNKTLFLQYPFLTIFFLKAQISTNNHTLLYIHINDHSLLYILINTCNNYHKKYT